MSDEKHLWEVDHLYYCNEGNYYAPGREQPFCEYASWAEFFAAEGDSDRDYNLLFRWDWREADPEEKNWGNKHEVLMLFWIGQRKGLYRWTQVRVTKDDEPVVRAFLADRFAHLKKLWEPLT